MLKADVLIGRLARGFTVGFALGAPVSMAIALPVEYPAASLHVATPESATRASQPEGHVLIDMPASPPALVGFVSQVRDKAADMVFHAMSFLGASYLRGGSNADTGFDCSGFTRRVVEASLGLTLPRRAEEQAKADGLLQVKRDDLQPGDLVFFNTLRRTFSHVGIYIGEGKFVHSPKPGDEVRVEDMRLVYWAKRFTGARRAESLMQSPAAAALLRPALTTQTQTQTQPQTQPQTQTPIQAPGGNLR